MPKISFEDIPTRRSCREPQLAEQLVTVNITVPRGSGRRLQDFLPEKIPQRSSPSSSLTFQVMVKVYKVYAQDRVCSVRSSTFLLVEVFTDFSQIMVIHALPQYRVKRLGKGFFGPCPGLKKKVRSPQRVRVRRGGQLMDAGGLRGHSSHVSSCAPSFSWHASLA